MPRRLLLLVPTSTYRAKAFVDAAKRLDVELSLASEKPSALSHLHPVSLPAFDFSDVNATLAFVERFAETTTVDAVAAVDDQATRAAAAVATRLGLPGNTPESVYRAQNKFETRRCQHVAGLPCPEHRLVPLGDDIAKSARTIGYPAVLKPLMMGASRGVIRVDDPGAFAEGFGRVRRLVESQPSGVSAQARENILIESYLPGREFAIEGIVTDGHLHVLCIFDKPDPLEGPTFPESIYVTPPDLDGEETARIVGCVQDAVTALGLTHGPIHAEVRTDASHCTLVEIATRSIGGLCSKVVTFADGSTLEDVILRHALDPSLPIPPLAPGAHGVMMMQAEHEGTFERVDGVDAARTVRGVEEVLISAHPGQKVTPLPEGFLYTGFIFARGDSADEVVTSLREAADRLTFHTT